MAPFANIKCTTCGALMPITEALQHQLSEQAEAKVREAVARREQELASKESTIVERERSVTLAEANIDARVQARLTSERSHIEETIRAAARADVDNEISELRAHAAAVDEGLKKAKQAELELRTQKRELEEEKATLQLEVARRIDGERAKLREEVERRIRVSNHRIAEKEAALEAREAGVLSAQSDIDARVHERISAEREVLEGAARAAAAEQFQVELQDLRERAA